MGKKDITRRQFLKGSAAGSGEAKSVEEAYVDYIREWLQNELLHNDQMTQEQIDYEYMPLIEAGDYTCWPVSCLYDGWLNTGVPISWQELNNWGNLFLTPEENAADGYGMSWSAWQGEKLGTLPEREIAYIAVNGKAEK